MNKKNLLYLVALVLNLCIAGGVYIFANNIQFLGIMWIYSAAACIGICACIYLYMKNRLAEADEKLSGKEHDIDAQNKRKDKMKIVIVVFMPFLAVLMCDLIYLYMLADSEIFSEIMSLFT